MRIGFIGPVDRYDSKLERIVAFSLDTLRIRQIVYVGAVLKCKPIAQHGWATPTTDQQQ